MQRHSHCKNLRKLKQQLQLFLAVEVISNILLLRDGKE